MTSKTVAVRLENATAGISTPYLTNRKLQRSSEWTPVHSDLSVQLVFCCGNRDGFSDLTIRLRGNLPSKTPIQLLLHSEPYEIHSLRSVIGHWPALPLLDEGSLEEKIVCVGFLERFITVPTPPGLRVIVTVLRGFSWSWGFTSWTEVESNLVGGKKASKKGLSLSNVSYISRCSITRKRFRCHYTRECYLRDGKLFFSVNKWKFVFSNFCLNLVGFDEKLSNPKKKMWKEIHSKITVVVFPESVRVCSSLICFLYVCRSNSGEI